MVYDNFERIICLLNFFLCCITVNLIRQAKLDAKIDSQQGHVVMGTQTTSPYQQLIEKTKALSFRSQMLQLNVEKKKKAQDQPNWGTDGF